MKPSHNNSEDQKAKIKSQIAELSRLLSMMPSDNTITIKEPVSEKEMKLSDWLSSTRDSFLKLSSMVRHELDIGLH